MIQGLHEDILTHQQPVMEAVHTAAQLIDRYNDRLKDQDVFKLKNSLNDLKSRFDNVTVQSYTRYNRLSSASEDLNRYYGDESEFETWLDDAEQQMADSERILPTNLEQLEAKLSEQKKFADDVVNHGADLKYVNKAGFKFLDNAKVYREDLQEFRTSVLPREFNRTFEEDPETDELKDQLNGVNDRFDRLKVRSGVHTERLSDLVKKHRAFKRNADGTSEWLEDTRFKLDELLEEPIASDPIALQEQINDLQVSDKMHVYKNGIYSELTNLS